MEEVSLAWHMKALNSYCSEDRREKLNRQLSAENGESYSQVLRADWTVFTGWLFTRPVNKMLQFKSMENIFPLTCMFIAPIYMLLVSLLKRGVRLFWIWRHGKPAVIFYNTVNDTNLNSFLISGPEKKKRYVFEIWRCRFRVCSFKTV